jgi:hypothetical protein
VRADAASRTPDGVPPATESAARSTARRFARLARAPPADRFGLFPLPDDGFCLSTFLVLHAPRRRGEILLGRVNPKGPWAEVGALDDDRLRALSDRWILPASQLLFFESPEESARRIATEQLRRDDIKLPAPLVFSESYVRGRGTSADPHWDLHFVFKSEWPGGDLSESLGSLWSELAFVPVKSTPTTAFGRAHGDILALAGTAPRPAPPE